MNIKRSKRNVNMDSADDMSNFFLSRPKTDKLDTENVLLNEMELGHSAMQGLRVSMEDKHIISCVKSLPDHTLVAIFDGKTTQCNSLVALSMLCP